MRMWVIAFFLFSINIAAGIMASSQFNQLLPYGQNGTESIWAGNITSAAQQSLKPPTTSSSSFMMFGDFLGGLSMAVQIFSRAIFFPGSFITNFFAGWVVAGYISGSFINLIATSFTLLCYLIWGATVIQLLSGRQIEQ